MTSRELNCAVEIEHRTTRAKTRPAAAAALAIGSAGFVLAMPMISFLIGLILGVIGLVLALVGFRATSAASIAGKVVMVSGIVLSVIAILFGAAYAAGARITEAMRRRGIARLIPATVIVATLGACSEPSPEPGAAIPLDLSNTDWIGQCQGVNAEVGTSTFAFGPGDAQGGTVVFNGPDVSGGAPIPYTLRGREISIELQPPWHGRVKRDRETLIISYTSGDTHWNRCYLTRTQLPPY